MPAGITPLKLKLTGNALVKRALVLVAATINPLGRETPY